MSLEETESYFSAIEIITAQETLQAFTASDFPHLNQDDREDLHRSIHKTAFPKTHQTSITPQQLAELIKAGKI